MNDKRTAFDQKSEVIIEWQDAREDVLAPDSIPIFLTFNGVVSRLWRGVVLLLVARAACCYLSLGGHRFSVKR